MGGRGSYSGKAVEASGNTYKSDFGLKKCWKTEGA